MSLRYEIRSEHDQYEYRERTTEGLDVWSDRPHLVHHVAGFGVRDDQNPSVSRFCGSGWQNSLRLCAEGMCAEVLRACYVAEVDSLGRCQPWTSEGLVSWLGKQQHSWFPSLLARRNLTPHYQPIFCLASGKVSGFESLARAEHEGRLVNGAELVHAARCFDEMRTFDQIARLRAVEVAGGELTESELLFVNVVPGTIRDTERDLATLWAQAEKAGLSTSQIVLEFVESEELPEVDQLRAISHAVWDRGARIALDDFGAGHGSLCLLETLKPDFVKFDRSLLPRWAEPGKKKLLQSLVSYAQSLGIKTVAEGIETIEHLALSQDCGFDYGQGWLLGKPQAELIRSRILECSRGYQPPVIRTAVVRRNAHKNPARV